MLCIIHNFLNLLFLGAKVNGSQNPLVSLNVSLIHKHVQSLYAYKYMIFCQVGWEQLYDLKISISYYIIAYGLEIIIDGSL